MCEVYKACAETNHASHQALPVIRSIVIGTEYWVSNDEIIIDGRMKMCRAKHGRQGSSRAVLTTRRFFRFSQPTAPIEVQIARGTAEHGG
jgi:hypothetical protein